MRYKVYSPNLLTLKPFETDDINEAYDYYGKLIVDYSFKNDTKNIRFTLEENGVIIDSGSFIN